LQKNIVTTRSHCKH